MAYAAVISLKQTIQQILNSSHILIVHPSLEIINSAYIELESVQEVLRKSDDSSFNHKSSERVNALDGQIRDAVWKLEDAIDSHLSDQLLPYESLGDLSYPFSVSLDLQKVKQDIDSFTQNVKKMKHEYFEELSKPSPEEDDASSSGSDFVNGRKSKMVGLSDDLSKIKDLLTGSTVEGATISLVGMPGIGKTTLAKQVFEDPSISNHFHFRVWVTVDPRTDIVEHILDQMDLDASTNKYIYGADWDSNWRFNILKDRRYLIVLDDILDLDVWDEVKRYFPDDNNGSRILLTTRGDEVDNSIVHQMRFLDKEESWDLLREKVFPNGSCPPQLVEAGMEIAEKCDGLPLAIVSIAAILSKVEKNPEFWNKVAAEKENSIFMDAVSSGIDSSRKKSKMVELSDDDDDAVSLRIDSDGKSAELSRIISFLLIYDNGGRLATASIVGSACVGKTTLAKKFFEDPTISHHYHSHAWVTAGPKYLLAEILRGILAQVNPSFDIDKKLWIGHQLLPWYLYRSLKDRKYLIVLDDIWDTQAWSYFTRYFPDDNNGSRVLLTTRDSNVAYFASPYRNHNMYALDNEESWHVFEKKVFPNGYCPSRLLEAGKKIVNRCNGLPFMIDKVADILSKAEKTPKYWNEVATEKENSIFMDAALSKSDSTEKKSKIVGLSNDDDVAVSLRIDSDGKKSKMVGLSNELGKIKDRLLIGSGKPIFVSLVGMSGIGKTTLAKEVFENPSILHHFDCRVWVPVGPKYRLNEILQSIIDQVNPGNSELLFTEGHFNLEEHLNECLKNKRYLIVLDDMWHEQVLCYLTRYFPYNDNGSGVLLTTTLGKVAYFDYKYDKYAVRRNQHRKLLLSEEDSWELLRTKVFLDVSCSFKLVEAGKKIAKNCEGLALTIVTVADILSKTEKTPDYWNEVAAAGKQHSVFKDAYEQISKVLLPGYQYLPQHLKACFLYIGVFTQNYKIPRSKLIKLWSAEGFLEPNPSQTVEDFAMKCLEELGSRNLAVISWNDTMQTIKTCSLYSVFWYLCNKEVGKNKLFHVLNTYADGLEEDQQYPVPVCLSLRLLRILDAIAIRFYQFPFAVLKLVHLKYLAITYNGDLPASIFRLWNLRNLIVHQHLRIKSSEDSCYLPREIWKMQELEHLEITGNDLPEPFDGASLPNLLTLSGVSTHSCTKKVFESTPNLKKLGIRIELAAVDVLPLCWFDHIAHLHALESLKCVIVNPELKLKVVTPTASLPNFPSSLKKLSLSGFGYPWEYMKKIASLPNLEVLILRSYAFRGQVWEICPKEFLKLKCLLLEDTDLVLLTVNEQTGWGNSVSRFPNLERLIIRHCYRLKKINLHLPRSHVEVCLFDCDPSASNTFQLFSTAYSNIHVSVHSSWDEVKVKA